MLTPILSLQQVEVMEVMYNFGLSVLIRTKMSVNFSENRQGKKTHHALAS